MATKKDLIENISKKLSYFKSADTEFAVNFILEYLKDELSKGNRIEIRGFGTISIRKRKQAKKAGEYNTIYYRMSKNVQEDLNK